MRVNDSADERELAWKAMLADTSVVSSDGDTVGTVADVLGSEAEDIFHGIVVREGILRKDVMIPADRVVRITNRRITVSMTAEATRELPPYQEEHSYKLGMVGLLRRRLGWVDDHENP